VTIRAWTVPCVLCPDEELEGALTNVRSRGDLTVRNWRAPAVRPFRGLLSVKLAAERGRWAVLGGRPYRLAPCADCRRRL
jgi:hypothetical protein